MSFEGLELELINLGELGVNFGFVGFAGSLDFDDDNAIAFVFDALDGEVSVFVLDLDVAEGLNKGAPVYAVSEDKVDGVEDFLKEFGELSGGEAAAVGASFLLVVEQVDVITDDVLELGGAVNVPGFDRRQ